MIDEYIERVAIIFTIGGLASHGENPLALRFPVKNDTSAWVANTQLNYS